MTAKKKTAGKTASGRPFTKGADPRRGKGRSGRPKDEVRQACRAAFDARLPRLEQLADDTEASVALKALDMLARFGGLTYTESNARLDAKVDPQGAVLRVYDLPFDGRSEIPRDTFIPGTGTGTGNGWRGVERRRTPRGPDD